MGDLDLVQPVRHLERTPAVDGADVTWGHPSGASEAETLRAPVAYGPEVLRTILEALPGLLEAFERAVARGRPPP